MRVVDLGPAPIEYRDWLMLQDEAVNARKSNRILDTIYLLEHAPTITVGRSSIADKSLLRSRDELEQRGVDVIDVDRGGDITYHAPGQLIAYPIVDLTQHGRDLHIYIRGLEQSIREALLELGVKTHTVSGMTGVWTEHGKIAAIGIKVSRWVTSHGLSLNNAVELTPMRRDIIPCGLTGSKVTSLEELGIIVSTSSLKPILAVSLCRFFGQTPEIELSSVANELSVLNSPKNESVLSS